MKLTRKVIAFGIAGLMVLGVGTAYAVNRISQPVKTPIEVASEKLVDETKVETNKRPSLENETPKVDETTVIEPSAEVTEPAPVEVRSFDEVIMDYPNMSNAPGVIACSHLIQKSWPEKFRDNNREANIKALSNHFSSACVAAKNSNIRETPLQRDFVYLSDQGSGDFFERFGE